MKTIDEKIGQELKKARDNCSMSLQDVSNIIGKSRYTLHGYEKGRNSISASTLFELCELYNIDIEVLFKKIKND
ncbi:helix-turn-helix domain-containing protein [Coprobacillus sp. AF33-1AC]|uniref:helix-turn-helix domain-containing protein n=1 Tax=Coprobacillus sp. AF33-1AC TaxID=2292032 RepID=UPI001314F914|nr:helix-turn-helix transcriptional regulator [Coprobacillus sp. AF33-1AC]